MKSFFKNNIQTDKYTLIYTRTHTRGLKKQSLNLKEYITNYAYSNTM